MNILKALFSKDQAIDSLSAGVDKAFYTKEEKSDDFIDLVKAYEPFKLAQRLLMLLLTVPFVLMIFISFLVFVASLFFDPCILDNACKSDQFAAGSKALLSMATDGLGEPMKWVVIFYFGGGAVEGIAKKVMNKNKG